MQRIMGVDQSLRQTGVVVAEGKKVVYYGIINSEPKYATILGTARRCIHIANSLAEIRAEYRVSTLNLEALSFGSRGNATRDLAILLGSIVTKLDKFVWQVVPPTTLKKFATGKGNASKEEMLDAIREYNPEFYLQLLEIPKTKGRYDLADAYWLSQYKE